MLFKEFDLKRSDIKKIVFGLNNLKQNYTNKYVLYIFEK